MAQTLVCDVADGIHRLKQSLNKLHERGYLLSPFSRWEKGRGRGAKLGRLETQALSPTLSQGEREAGQTKKFCQALKPDHGPKVCRLKLSRC